MGVLALYMSIIVARSISKGNDGLRFSHAIAVLGYPRSGKTTLIVTTLYRILSSHRARNVRVTGKETVEKISAYNEQILKGVNLTSTADKDSFLYRFQYEKAEHSLLARILGRTSRSYDVAVADFPGEYSEDLAEGKKIRRRKKAEVTDHEVEVEASLGPSHVGRLYDPEYHSWISQADKFLILVDIVDLVKSSMDTSEVKARIFSAVFYLKESSLEESKSLHQKPAALVFTKSDLLASSEFNLENIDNYNYKSINKVDFDMDSFQKSKDILTMEFDDTIKMLKNNFSYTSVIFHSSYMRAPVFDEAADQLIAFVVP